MSDNIGVIGMLRRLAGQWAAHSGRSLYVILGTIMMLVENMLGTSDGVRPHGTQAWRMTQLPARRSRPIASKRQAVVRHASSPFMIGGRGRCSLS